MSRRRVKTFWFSYRSSRFGGAGLAILIFFLFISISAPFLTPYDPLRDRFLAEGVALPSWYRIMPQYSTLPETMNFNVTPHADGGNWTFRAEGPFRLIQDDPLTLSFQMTDRSASSAAGELTHYFSYDRAPPLSFQLNTNLQFGAVTSSVYQIELLIVNPDFESFLIWSSGLNANPLDSSQLQVDSKGLTVEYKSRMGLAWHQNVAEKIFSKKGLYA